MQAFTFVVLAMIAGVAMSDSETESQLSTVDSTYSNNVPVGSRPTGFYYSVQTYDQPKVQVPASTIPAAGYVNPYAGYAGYTGYGYGNQYPYYNQGLYNNYAGYGASPYVANPYTAASVNPYAAAVNPYAAAVNPYAAAVNPYSYAGYPYTAAAARLG